MGNACKKLAWAWPSSPWRPWTGAVLGALVLLAAASPASADRLERFANAVGEPIAGYLAKPAGAGPFPAVVLLHSCLGFPSNRKAIETALAGAGYVVLFVDEFSTRGLKETCSVDFPQLVPDAFGALADLARRPDVDAGARRGRRLLARRRRGAGGGRLALRRRAWRSGRPCVPGGGGFLPALRQRGG